MVRSIASISHDIDSTTAGNSSPPPADQRKAEASFGLIIAGKALCRRWAEQTNPHGSPPYIQRTLCVQTVQGVADIDVVGLDCIFIVVDLSVDGDLAKTLEVSLQTWGSLPICIALSDPGRTLVFSNLGSVNETLGVRMPIVSFPIATGLVSSAAESLRAFLEKAIHVSNCFARTVLDGRLVGVSFEDLCTNIFKPAFDCIYQFEVLSIALDCTPDAPFLCAEPKNCGLKLAGASAALVIVETSNMPEVNALHLARNWMNAVRSQMPKRADCFYAVTINNDLKDQSRASVLAVSTRGAEP